MSAREAFDEGGAPAKSVTSRRAASAVIAVATVLLPLVSRLPRGTDWMLQYVPGDMLMLPGALVYAGFAVVPALPLILAWNLGRRGRVFFVTASAVTAVLLVLAHRDYDLSSHAQAGVGLAIIPVLVTVAASLAGILASTAERALRKAARPS